MRRRSFLKAFCASLCLGMAEPLGALERLSWRPQEDVWARLTTNQPEPLTLEAFRAAVTEINRRTWDEA